MRHTLKILASVFLIAGLAAGFAIAYSGYTNPEENSTKFDGCPAYATAKPIFEANTGQSWAKAGRLATLGGTADGALAGNLPRNNLIDDYIFDKMEADDIPHALLCTDAEFMRRVYLDLTGRIPSAGDVRTFVADTDPNKRDQLVDTLLDRPEYLDRMTMWFGDLFQTGYGGFGAIGLFFGRSAFNTYLRQALQEDRPYNEMVMEMLISSGDNWEAKDAPANFIARNFEQMANQYDILDNTAAQVARVFLGVPATCITCHSGAGHLEQVNTYLSTKRRYDLWGLSSFFSGVRVQLEIRSMMARAAAFIVEENPSDGYDLNSPQARGGTRPERRAGPDDPLVSPQYFFTGDKPTSSDSMKWRGELAQILTEDPQFARATVNYLWKEFFGMGIVDPPDAFDLARDDQATHPELLAALGQEFVDSGYDIKHMIGLMVKSTAYQLSARFPGQWEARYAPYFARHFAKRLTAEMALDSVVKSSGVPNTYYVEMYPGDIREIQWAMQLPDTVEPRPPLPFGGNSPFTPQQEQANTRSRSFLDLFFRGNRGGEPRKAEGSVQQALAMMNNPLTFSRSRYGSGGLVDRLVDDKALTNEQMVDELFLSTLSRYPTGSERDDALAILKTVDRAQAIGGLYLALINKLDFMFY